MIRPLPRHHPSRNVLWAVAAAVLLLNLFDAVATLVWVNLGIAHEANELLAHLLDRNAVLFMAVKLALVFLGVGLLWRRRERRLAVFGLVLALVAYASLGLYHVHVARVALRGVVA
jgi:hypothetical protein